MIWNPLHPSIHFSSKFTHQKNWLPGLLLLILLATSLTISYSQDTDTTTVFPDPLITDYLVNPGIGWQHAPGIGTPLLPETVVYPQRSDISWRILNPGDGVYEWDVLDALLNSAIEDDKQFSFRVYTMRGEDFGGHQIPQWVLDAGAEILPVGEPDYSNCAYQENWAGFVSVLQERYDGHPNIAFMDISGYGDFNEWSWRDEQTEWDDLWYSSYEEGEASPETMEILDSQARRRLVDMFIGGQVEGHECRTSSDEDAEILRIDYNYPGFQETQLVMPFAGIRQSTQYVFTQRTDVGFRYDCLGREDSDIDIIDGLGEEIEGIWRNAPVVFELCGSLDDGFFETAANLMQSAHGSIVHDNLDDEDERDKRAVVELMRNAGYRYFLSEVTFSSLLNAGDDMTLEMLWQNTGYAPAYPLMGHDFELQVYLIDENDEEIISSTIENSDIADWMPADIFGESAPDNIVNATIDTSGIVPGIYRLEIAILNRTTGEALQLAIAGKNQSRRYSPGSVEIES